MTDDPGSSTATPDSTPDATTDLSEFGYRQELNRSLRLRDLIVYGLIFMVPIAPFAIFGPVFNASHGMVPLTYVIGLVAMIFTALSYREMSRAFPVSGSVYAYAGRGIANWVGFLAGWALILDYLLIPTLLYVTGAAAMAAVLPGVPGWLWVVIFLVLNTAVNLAGVELGAWVNRVFLIGEMIVLTIFIVLAIVTISHGHGGAHWSTLPFYNPKEFSVGLVFTALSIAALSFLGFDAISTQSEEVKGGPRVVGRATIISLILVAILFIAQTYLAALLVPGKTAFSDADVNQAFYQVAGLTAGHWMTILIAVSSALAGAIANSLVAQNAISRLLYSMGRDRVLPKFLAHVSKRKVPERAILVVAVISLILGIGFVGQVEFLSTLVNFGALFSFLLLHISVAFYYLIKKRQKTYGMHLVVPLIGFLIIGYVEYSADTPAKIGGGIWLGIGVIVLLIRIATGRGSEINLDESKPA